jgi:hypothetical protein
MHSLIMKREERKIARRRCCILRKPSYERRRRSICIESKTPNLPGTILSSLDNESILMDFVGRNDYFLVLSHHFMLEVPTCTLAYFRDDGVTISEKVDVEVDVMDGLVFTVSKILQSQNDLCIRDLLAAVEKKKSKLTSRDMYICGTVFGTNCGISETGATFMLVPITMIRSTVWWSVFWSVSKNFSGSFSPKKVMSGCFG